MSDPEPGQGGRPVLRLFGALLIAAGVLIAALAGLCSMVFLVMLGTSPSSAASGEIPIIVIVGGMPFVLGVGAIFGGIAMRKAGKTPRP